MTLECDNSKVDKQGVDNQAFTDDAAIMASITGAPLSNGGGGGGPLNEETEEERQKRIERENAEKNELSLIRMLVRHNQNIGVSNNLNIFKTPVDQPPSLQSVIISDESGADEYFSRDEFRRTASMVSMGTGKVEVMSKRYKLVTSSVLWFCYFSLALNDYIFGPTFDDLSIILNISFEQIAYFAVIRQCAYTLGSLGGVAFDYVNRQLSLILLLLLSGVTLFFTPFVSSLGLFFGIGVLNGFAAGACDVGFHVWILEMFQNGGGPLLQALHFSFGIGITFAPLISANFLSGESECNAGDTFSANLTSAPLVRNNSIDSVNEKRHNLAIPYSITGVIVSLGGLALLLLYVYKRYIPPKERKLPMSFDEQMPKQLSRMEKLELWKKSVPSFYIMLIIMLGSLLIWSYYGLEVTYLQFLAQFSTATPLPISGKMSANLEAATGGAYAIGGAIAIFASFRFHPERMVYVNFVLMNIGNIVLILATQSSLTWFWIGNILVGFGFSSCYATVYTFLEHQINVTNLIGSVFLFAGGAGTALFPMVLRDICNKPVYFIYLSFFCSNLALVLFILMHVMTQIRHKQVKLIQDQLMKDPATLTKFKERSISTLSYEPQ